MFEYITTLESLPIGVYPPITIIEPGRLDTIIIQWQPPREANGKILWYIIYRDGVEIFRAGESLSRSISYQHVDRNAIYPYKMYNYYVNVCNSAGCVGSDKVKIATLQATPQGVRRIFQIYFIAKILSCNCLLVKF